MQKINIALETEMKKFKVITKSGKSWIQTGKNGGEAMGFAIMNGVHRGMKKGDKIICLRPIEDNED